MTNMDQRSYLPVDVETALSRMVEAMRYKLHANRKKGVWENITIEQALQFLRDEVDELEEALTTSNRYEIIMECADVANFALILSDVLLRELSKKERNNG